MEKLTGAKLSRWRQPNQSPRRLNGAGNQRFRRSKILGLDCTPSVATRWLVAPSGSPLPRLSQGVKKATFSNLEFNVACQI